MASDFPYVYPNSRAEARRVVVAKSAQLRFRLRRKLRSLPCSSSPHGTHFVGLPWGPLETQMHEDSLRLNVDCARAIEQAIRDHFDEADKSLAEGCAQSVLERFGFKRVNFVLANSLKQTGCPELIGEDIHQWGRGTYIPSDSKYNRYYAVDTAAPLLEAFIGQVRDAYQALGLFGPEHCVGDRHEQDYTGKVLVLSTDTLRESCWDPHNMLWLAEGGFGCSPHSSGRAVYATCLGDREKTRWNRSDFTGVLDEQYLPDWATEKLEELRGPQQEQNGGPTMGGMT